MSEADGDNGLAAPNRAQRRRMETRGRLIEAGRKVFADKGVDAATIQDITDTADVGRGSFYNFFDTKEDLVGAIVSELVEDLVQLEGFVSREYDDPMVALVATLRASFQMMSANPPLAWFIVRTQRVGGPLFGKFHDLTVDLIKRGVAAGKFKVEDPELALILLGGNMLTGIEAILLGLVPPEAGDQIVECTLRSLGVPVAAAQKAVAAQLPSLEALLSPS